MSIKYIFITGGVVSSLGKGLTAASIGYLLETRGLKIAMLKFDPYLNVDPGTMNPFQHGEVYVTDDGGETDLDLGHYHRFTHSPLSRASNATSGQIYDTVIKRERKGDFLGKTVQVIPHVTDEIKNRLRHMGQNEDCDVLITEIGGTTGDIEAQKIAGAEVKNYDDIGMAFLDLMNGQVDAVIADNPLDLWGTGADTRALFTTSLRAIVADPAVAVTALAVDLVSEFDGDTAYPDAVIDVAASTDAPIAVLASVSSAIDTATMQRLRGNGVAVLENARSGIAALGHLADWPRPVGRTASTVDIDRRRRWSSRLAAPDWSAHDAFALLADYGVPVAPFAVARDLRDVLAAADQVGYPVALKTTGAEHKSDVGGVVLGIADAATLNGAYREMADRLGREVSVHAMAGAGVEVSVGVVRDGNFGPLVVVAAGGTHVELLMDRAVACPPLNRTEALSMLRSLRIARLLTGWRGDPPVDIDALADAVVGFSELADELGDIIDAAEANPVIASPAGAVAVDALLIVRDQKIE